MQEIIDPPFSEMAPGFGRDRLPAAVPPKLGLLYGILFFLSIVKIYEKSGKYMVETEIFILFCSGKLENTKTERRRFREAAIWEKREQIDAETEEIAVRKFDFFTAYIEGKVGKNPKKCYWRTQISRGCLKIPVSICWQLW